MSVAIQENILLISYARIPERFALLAMREKEKAAAETKYMHQVCMYMRAVLYIRGKMIQRNVIWVHLSAWPTRFSQAGRKNCIVQQGGAGG